MKGGQIDMSPDEPWSLSDGDPPSAVSIAMRSGDAVVFDRRIVHSQPRNPLVGDGLRKAVFLGYSCTLPCYSQVCCQTRGDVWCRRQIAGCARVTR